MCRRKLFRLHFIKLDINARLGKLPRSFNTGKTGKSVLFYFVLSFASSLITNLITAILTATKLLQGERDFSQITNLSTALSLSISVILIGVYYFITWIMTRKRLNLA